ncbi:MAG: alcohol dehydrogenase, partial [Halieaceae bacterium]|nr:alcohol dehydrogenase [Halieaceae bacterium]
MELPLKPNGLQASDIPSVVEEALAEAGDLYPVPRYMTEIEVTAIVRDLLPTT